MIRPLYIMVLFAVAAGAFYLGLQQRQAYFVPDVSERVALRVVVENVAGPLSEVSVVVMPQGEVAFLKYDPAEGLFEAEVTVPADARFLLANAYHENQVVGHGVATLSVPAEKGRRIVIPIEEGTRPFSEPAPYPLATQNAMERGIEFLADAQRPWGEFGAEWCDDRWLERRCRDFKSSTFPTAFIVYALLETDHPRSRPMIESAIEFLRSEERPDGSWPYWSSRAEDMPGDVDTTAMVAYVLSREGIAAENHDFLLGNRTEEGAFWTWFDDYPFENDVDCVVNANALLYLGEIPAVCDYVNEAVHRGRQCSIYYEDELDLTYAASRAYREGASCLEAGRSPMVDTARRRLSQPASALETALALNTLLNLEDDSPEVDAGVERLLSLQAPDGGWRAEGLYCVDCRDPLPKYFGSRELTAGIVLEALAKYTAQRPEQ